MPEVYYNGTFVKKNTLSLSIDNRGFKYGDSFFETIRCHDGKPLFWEEHYFRIAGSFCVLKMDPPLDFESENIQSIIIELLIRNNLESKPSRIRITFFRLGEGYYLPNSNQVQFFMEAEEISNNRYQLNKLGLHVSLYQENIISHNSISNIKSNNKLINILAAIYASDNNYDDCILLNHNKHIVESISGNIFIVLDGKLQTPPLSDGCIDGVMRRIILKNKTINTEEKSISILELFNADEIFITNVISGIKWIATIRSHTYQNNTSVDLIKFLNKQYLV